MSPSPRGVAVLLLLSGAGLVAGLLTMTVAILGQTTVAAVRSQTATVAARSAFTGGVADATASVSERTRDRTQPPPRASDLGRLSEGKSWRLEDEGGKLAVPEWLPLLPTILVATNLMGGAEATDRTTAFANLWQLPLIQTRDLTYPYPLPFAIPDLRHGLESPEELLAMLGLPARKLPDLERVLTSFDQGGVNLNTAVPEVLQGLIDWHWKSSLQSSRPPLQGTVKDMPSGPTRTAEVVPLPSPDPIMVFRADPAVPLGQPPLAPPAGFLDLPLPTSLMSWQPAPFHYVQGKLFASMHIFTNPGRSWYEPSWGLSSQWFRGLAMGIRPWVSRVPVSRAADIVAAREQAALTPDALTQPLGLFWIQPDASWMPFSSLSSADLKGPSGYRPASNAALSAAVFSGWIALHGPAAYRASSETHAVSLARGTFSARAVVRRDGDRLPLVLYVREGIL